MLQGGMGMAASGNLNPAGVSMFEPIHGSAPQFAEQNVACPLAAIMAVQMMLDHLGEAEAAERVERAVMKALASGRIKSLYIGRMGMSTSEVGDFVASLV